MKITLFAIGILLATNITAEGASSVDSSMCPMFGNIAKQAMISRQANVPMSNIIEAIEAGLGKGDPIGNFGKTIVIQAYEEPLYVTEEIKQREIVNFSNVIMQACYKHSNQ